MENRKMDREEILRRAAEQNGPDEREEHYDLTSTDDAYLIGQILCSGMALIKMLVFRKKPYDIFAIQLGSETAFLFRKWKALREKRCLFAMIISGTLFFFSLGAFFKGDVDMIKKE